MWVLDFVQENRVCGINGSNYSPSTHTFQNHAEDLPLRNLLWLFQPILTTQSILKLRIHLVYFISLVLNHIQPCDFSCLLLFCMLNVSNTCFAIIFLYPKDCQKWLISLSKNFVHTNYVLGTVNNNYMCRMHCSL